MAQFVDKNGNVIKPILANTAKDGSGTDLIPIVDSDGHLQVDSLSALPAGDNNIGNVDIASAIPAGTNLIGKVSIDQVTANANEVVLKAGTAAIGKVGHDTTGLGHGVKTVSTVGTDEALAASTPCKWVVIQAQTDNTSKVAVGATGVDATVATGNGLILDPGDWTPRIDIDNLADIYIDALVAGEGVRYIYGS